MMFKKKLVARKKENKEQNKRDAGKIRIKVRGRKRWVDPTAKKEA